MRRIPKYLSSIEAQVACPATLALGGRHNPRYRAYGPLMRRNLKLPQQILPPQIHSPHPVLVKPDQEFPHLRGRLPTLSANSYRVMADKA